MSPEAQDRDEWTPKSWEALEKDTFRRFDRRQAEIAHEENAHAKAMADAAMVLTVARHRADRCYERARSTQAAEVKLQAMLENVERRLGMQREEAKAARKDVQIAIDVCGQAEADFNIVSLNVIPGLNKLGANIMDERGQK